MRLQVLQSFTVQNPWLNLPPESPYILEMDSECVNRYNESRTKDTIINFESIPEPFIGNPESAVVVLLNLNPGDSDEDWKARRDDELKKAMRDNLHHEWQEYPFYYLNPKFSWTAGGKWWRRRFRQLSEAGLDDKTLAKGLLVIEWFPYHSKKSALSIERVCESQNYSFQLAKEMLEKKRVVVGMRAKKHWVEVDPRFSEVPFLKSPRNPVPSKQQAGEELFERSVDAFR
jgi:hypothetical protein